MTSSVMKSKYGHALRFSKRDATEMIPREAQVAVNKSALSFILASFPSSELGLQLLAYPAAAGPPLKRKRIELNTTARAVSSKTAKSAPQLLRNSDTNSTFRLPKKTSKLCVVDGCTSRAKFNKLCWRHGGSVKCKVADCDNRAKSKGVCWSHGGGTLCSFDKCDTISVSNGFCWAHGGGKRCMIGHCSKPACERTQNYCTAHFKKMITSSSNDLEA